MHVYLNYDEWEQWKEERFKYYEEYIEGRIDNISVDDMPNLPNEWRRVLSNSMISKNIWEDVARELKEENLRLTRELLKKNIQHRAAITNITKKTE